MATVTAPLTKYALPQTSTFNLITGSYEVCQCMDDTVHIVGGYSTYVGCSHQQGFGIEIPEWNHSIHISMPMHPFNSCTISHFQVTF